MIRPRANRLGEVHRTLVPACVFAVIALFCALGLCAPAATAAAPAEDAAGPVAAVSDQLPADRDLIDLKEPGSTCHPHPGTPADPVPPPPVPLPIPAPDPASPAARALAAACPGGAAHDGVASVDLHRLQVQRT